MATPSKPIAGGDAGEVAEAIGRMQATVSLITLLTSGDDADAIAALTGALIMVAARAPLLEVADEVLAVAQASLQTARTLIRERIAASARRGAA